MSQTANRFHALTLLNLNVEPAADGQSVLLEQDTGGRVHHISLHASQVTAVAQIMDLAGTEVERLHRALLRSWELVARLQHSLGITSDFGREDLEWEIGLARETHDFLAFVCADFHERYGPLPSALDPMPTAAPAPSASAAAANNSTRPPTPPAASVSPRATSLGHAGSGELFQGATQ